LPDGSGGYTIRDNIGRARGYVRPDLDGSGSYTITTPAGQVEGYVRPDGRIERLPGTNHRK
jgi:hypothetical protein